MEVSNIKESIKEKGFESAVVIGSTVRNQFSDFVDFIRRQGIVGFAVAFILGGAI